MHLPHFKQATSQKHDLLDTITNKCNYVVLMLILLENSGYKTKTTIFCSKSRFNETKKIFAYTNLATSKIM